MEERPTVKRGETQCPACGGRLVPIQYGLPSPDAMRSMERGEVILGGCILSGDDPHVACAKCRKPYWHSGERPGSTL